MRSAKTIYTAPSIYSDSARGGDIGLTVIGFVIAWHKQIYIIYAPDMNDRTYSTMFLVSRCYLCLNIWELWKYYLDYL